LEEVILVTQVLRVIIVIALVRAHRVQPLFGLVLFSLEVFAIPVLALAAAWTGDPIYTTWMAMILSTWIGVSSIVLTPFAIYEFANSMAKGTSIVGTLVIGTLELGGMLFLWDAMSGATGKIQGPSALGTLIIQGGKFQISSLSFLGNSSNEAIAIGLVGFSIGMMCYLALGNRESISQVRISYAMLLPLAGLAMTIAWMFAVMSFSTDILFIFTIPTIVGAFLLWGSTLDR
jgi:hypothetical protein